MELNVGNTAQLTATITPANTTDKRIIWTSSSPNTASVSSNGLVTANGNGQCLITATTLDGTNLSASCIVTVNGGGGGGVVADNYLSAADIEEVVAGQSFVIPIALTNQDPITAIQADMYLPNGVIVPDYNDDDEFVVLEPSRMGRGHSVATTVTQISTRILVSSSRNAAFQGNEGTVMYIYLKMAENAGVGIYGIDLKNIRLTTTSGQLINAPDVVISVGAVAYHGGDANGDGYVDDTDYAITVNYLLGQTSSDFKFEAADMSGDGYVLVNDLPMIIDAALAYDFGASNAPRRDLLKAAANNKMYVSDFDLGGNATKTLNILLNNATAFAAVQCDIELPTGLSIVEQTDEWGDLAYALPVAARFNGHESWTDLTGLGDVRLIIASSSNKSLRSTSGAVATFKVRSAAGFSGEHELVLKNIVCADANAVRYALPDAVCLINHAANLPGDIDGNGAVNGTDLNILINIILGKDNAANYGGRANVNGEGGVDGNDLN
ncbi:MAG: Ig-like domain-containing protein, partial [Muribaculaceae bacterium]|nr:Ig-like domain-containing protein [Muribaculaceae bacterium]